MGAVRPQTPHRSPRQAFRGASHPHQPKTEGAPRDCWDGPLQGAELFSTVMHTKSKTTAVRLHKKAHPSSAIYAGIDLHSNNLFVALLQEDGGRISCSKLPCDIDSVLLHLEPYKKRLQGIAIESTFNWYWLV